MGCGSSRPSSARSWQAVEGWRGAPSPPPDDPAEFGPDGKVAVRESSAQRGKTGEEGPYEERRSRDFGDGMLGVEKARATQRKIATLKKGELFRDEDFPADNSSLFYSERSAKERSVQWNRPCRLVKQPQVRIDGISRDDIMQGVLGDCWFLSSCAAIAQNPRLMRRVVPEGQALFGNAHRGAARLRFWRFGEWVEVWVDDRLPVREGKLVYGHNTEPAEFWVALVEKAYAKLHGSYEAIEGGQAMDALVDLTGGLAERYELADHTYDLYHKLARASSTGAFITCSRKGDWRAEHEEVDEFGLIAGHAYTVTDVKRIKRKHGAECLLRVRNPWGMGQEWKVTSSG